VAVVQKRTLQEVFLLILVVAVVAVHTTTLHPALELLARQGKDTMVLPV
jgi:hypothetical protein